MKVSIISLIYRSPRMADWMYESLKHFTPMLADGDAEFFFVANDPSQVVINHLDSRGYPFIVNENEQYTEEGLFALGYGTPEYMSRVYRGYNVGIQYAKGDWVVAVNSDNFFSPYWLENLMKRADPMSVVASTLVERVHPRHGVFPGAVHGEFGGTINDFDEVGFLEFAESISEDGVGAGAAYMPALFNRRMAFTAGLYPCGNLAGDTFDLVARYGDEAFYAAMGELGVHHYTAKDSIVYHLKEGETDDLDGCGDEPQLREVPAGVPRFRTPILRRGVGVR